MQGNNVVSMTMCICWKEKLAKVHPTGVSNFPDRFGLEHHRVNGLINSNQFWNPVGRTIAEKFDKNK